MVVVKPEILDIAKRYIQLLEDTGYPVKEVYLFGSYSQGREDEWSDIDIAVVSDKFEGNRFLDKEKIRGLYRKVDNRLSILPLNSSSLDSYFIQHEIINKGIQLF
ncbi:MAG: nucleotidyltransferase domain-containing protein [Bacteroidetes bacterium]|nr:MAG: nucleotidyltransferase domain-containing protein [Bacteroidota bacterium]